MDEMPKMMFNPYDQMKAITQSCLRKQVRKAVDYIGPDGLLVCGVCGHPMQTYIEVPNPTPDHMSKLLTTTSCECDRKAEREEKARKQAIENQDKISRFRSFSMLDDKFKGISFEMLEETMYNTKNLRTCRRYAERFGNMVAENQGLLLWGNVGTGKSWAAAAIANYLLGKVIPVVMVSFVEIIKDIESKKKTQEEIISLVNSAQLVIFDDLGAERGSDFALEKVYSIIDSRYRKQLPMIVTTNLTMEQMKEETDIRYCRIYDRIFETCYPMQFSGPSWRRVEASKRFTNMASLLGD